MEKLIELKDFVIKFIKLNKNLVLKLLVTLIIVITAIIVITSTLKKEEFGNSAGNINNFGISSTSGKWIYYMAIDDNEPFGIYRVKVNGDKKEKIVEGNYAYINVLDNYIYCLEFDDNEKINLVKMKKNGEKKEILSKNVDNSPITVIDNNVYYFKDNDFYRIKTDCSDREKISNKNITYYQIYDNTIYYIYENEGNSNIATMKLNGENSKRIARLTDSVFTTLQIKNNKIYYIVAEVDEENNSTDYTLYKMNIKGSKQEKICKLPEGIELINMQEDYIYYAIEGAEYEIYKVNYKAGNKELITEVSDLYFMNVSENWLFFVTEDGDNNIIIERITTDGKKEQKL